MSFCWATFTAIPGCMWPLGRRLDAPGGVTLFKWEAGKVGSKTSLFMEQPVKNLHSGDVNEMLIKEFRDGRCHFPKGWPGEV